jgi:hypothetical protein
VVRIDVFGPRQTTALFNELTQCPGRPDGGGVLDVRHRTDGDCPLLPRGCGSPIGQSEASAEYNQVTVLFAEAVIPLGVT